MSNQDTIAFLTQVVKQMEKGGDGCIIAFLPDAEHTQMLIHRNYSIHNLANGIIELFLREPMLGIKVGTILNTNKDVQKRLTAFALQEVLGELSEPEEDVPDLTNLDVKGSA